MIINTLWSLFFMWEILVRGVTLDSFVTEFQRKMVLLVLSNSCLLTLLWGNYELLWTWKYENITLWFFSGFRKLIFINIQRIYHEALRIIIGMQCLQTVPKYKLRNGSKRLGNGDQTRRIQPRFQKPEPIVCFKIKTWKLKKSSK